MIKCELKWFSAYFGVPREKSGPRREEITIERNPQSLGKLVTIHDEAVWIKIRLFYLIYCMLLKFWLYQFHGLILNQVIQQKELVDKLQCIF